MEPASDKYRTRLTVLFKSLEYRNDPPKMAEYISQNKSCFPHISSESIQEMLQLAPDDSKNQTQKKPTCKSKQN